MFLARARKAFSNASVKTKAAAKLVPTSDKYNPIMCISEYGDLLNVKPMTKMHKIKSGQPVKEDLR